MGSKMSEMGITATAEAVFTKGSFAVIKITVSHVELEKLLANKMGDSKASKISGALHLLEKVGVDVDGKIDAKMGPKIIAGLSEKLPSVLPEKMSEKGLIVDVVAKKDGEEQHSYLAQVFAELFPGEEVPEIAF